MRHRLRIAIRLAGLVVLVGSAFVVGRFTATPRAGGDRAHKAVALALEARRAAEGLADPAVRDGVLAEVAGALAFGGRADDARAISARITDVQQRMGAFFMIAMAHASAGRAAAARAALDEIRDPSDPGMPEELMVSMIRVLAEANQTAGWRELVATIQDPRKRAAAMDAVVTSLVKQGRVSEALAAAEEIRDAPGRARGHALAGPGPDPRDGLRPADLLPPGAAAGVQRAQERKGTAYRRPAPGVRGRTRLLRAEKDERRRLLGPEYQDHRLVFCQPDGKPLHARNIVRGDFRRVTERARLPRIRFHDLRHTHASHLLQQGVHPKVVQERLGPATPAFTLHVYSHAMPGMQEEAARALEARLLGRLEASR